MEILDKYRNKNYTFAGKDFDNQDKLIEYLIENHQNMNLHKISNIKRKLLSDVSKVEKLVGDDYMTGFGEAVDKFFELIKKGYEK